jgi:hypothetical protein
LGKWAGTQSTITPIPARWKASTSDISACGGPNRLVAANMPIVW